MNDKGLLLASEANRLLTARKDEYSENKEALGIVNSCNVTAFETRFNEKAYMLTQQQKYQDSVEEKIKQLLDAYEKLEKMRLSQEEKDQITEARKATQEYMEAFKAWVDEQKRESGSDKLPELAESIEKKGTLFNSALIEYTVAKEVKVTKIYEAMIILSDIAQEVLSTRLSEKTSLLYKDETYWTALSLRTQKLLKLYQGLGRVSWTNDDRQMIAKATSVTEEYQAAADSCAANDNKLRTEILPKMTQLGETVIARTQAVEKDTAQKADQRGLEVSAIVGTSKGIIIIALVIGVLMGMGAAVIVTRSITKPINKGVKLAVAIQSGDLSQRLRMDPGDEIGVLAHAMDDMADTLGAKAKVAGAIADGDLDQEVILASDKDVLGQALQKMVMSLNDALGQVNEAVKQAVSGAGQVSDASLALSQGAAKQAAALEQITSSMTQMASQTKSNAENASQANKLALFAREAAESGNGQMVEMTSAMKGINDSSKEIAKIIKAIDDIAFQTNLLALNAAVEAARAGKHGKGFAVVAQEVRNLAGRSAKAAQETAELIEDSMKKAENGANILAKTAKSLADIVDRVTKAADLVGEIAASSNEQAQGIAQINQGLSQIEQVTHQNTANAEQTASAAEELAGQAANLQEIVGQFKLKNQDSPALLSFQDSNPLTPMKQLAPAAPSLPGGGRQPAELQKLSRGEQIVKPEEVISLDDDDFGKY
ncbi:MAG: HAMP domain-containing protein [Deltaproteobacteria bacterium]|nr:HAMP domain-containing protein [Deltaproteobacteria bacterium]